MSYEIVCRNVITGMIVCIVSGFDKGELAKEVAESNTDESVRCEVRKEEE